MASDHVLEAYAHRDSTESERVFGDESAFDAPNFDLVFDRVKRVAIFAEAFLPKVDGVSKTAYLTLRYLQRTGREVIVFAPDIAPSSVHGSPVIPLPSLGFKVAPETRIALPHPVVVQHITDFKPDLIHMFSPAVLSMSGMLMGRQVNIPVIANYQTDLPSYAAHYGMPFFSGFVNDWLRLIHNGCHMTLVPSNYTLRELRRNGYHRLRRWGRGVNGARFNPNRRSQAMRDRLLNGRDPASLLCIYVGRLANEKRVDLLLDVARTPGVSLTIIGDGALRPELETLFEGTDTHFTGYMFGDELAHAYASADAFFFTGVSETFGQVVQEALASGLPAVIINQGGITDLVEHGVNGFICADDPAEFAEAARTLRDDRALRRQMSISARTIADRNPWTAIMAQLEGYYEEAYLLNQRMARMYPPRWNFLSWRMRRVN